MGSQYFSFFILRSSELKARDICLKISARQETHYMNFRIPKVQFLVSFLDSKPSSLQNVRALAGFTAQVFQSTIRLHVKAFGLKNSVNVVQFWQLKYSEMLKYFWLYCPNSVTIKFIPLGVKGAQFRYVRFLIFDIFNFFGGEFYQLFYMNYFDFPGVFALDLFSQLAFDSCRRAGLGNQSDYLRVFLTFFKCLLRCTL